MKISPVSGVLTAVAVGAAAVYAVRFGLQNRRMSEMITGFEEIADWAANHHEKLNGKGYPYGFDKSRLDFNSRLLACVDIYQALTEERPYRKALSHNQAIGILRNMANQGLIDATIVEDIGVSLSPAAARKIAVQYCGG